MEWDAFVLGLLVGLLAFFLGRLLVRWIRSRAATRKHEREVGLGILHQLEVTLTDWGEDFTGEGDVLARWRWQIFDRDPVRTEDSVIGVTVPYMVGNSPTPREAVEAANAWCCETYGHHRYSLVVRRGADVG